jgi:DNA-binding NarL/FixJ family response regulator
MSPGPIRVFLVDDHKVLLAGLSSLLETETDIHVVGSAGTVAEALVCIQEVQPDVMIVDLGLPDRNGLELITEVVQRQLAIRMIVLSMHSNQEVVRKALEAGCDGYIPKESAHNNLVEAIRVVHAGGRYLHPVAASALVDALQDLDSEKALFASLSEREQEVVRYTAMGFSSRETAGQLHLSPKTVETYRQRVYEKLGIGQRKDLVRFALAAGILDDFKGEPTF